MTSFEGNEASNPGDPRKLFCLIFFYEAFEVIKEYFRYISKSQFYLGDIGEKRFNDIGAKGLTRKALSTIIFQLSPQLEFRAC